MDNLNNKITVGFTGDFSFSGYFSGCYKNEDLIDEKVLDFFDSNDANVINFESPITQCIITSRILAHKSDAESLDFIKNKIKNPIISLANNHMMDYSHIGLIDTLENLESKDIPYIGAGKNLKDAARYSILENGDFKVGIFAVQLKKGKKASEKKCGPLHESHIKTIKETIAELKSKTDKIVLVYHGGTEFLNVPMPYVRKQLKKYLKMGCDVVVAHHPHVVQGYEQFGDKFIFYSLGNFMFDTDYQRAQENTDKGVVLKLILSESSIAFDHMVIKIDRENHRVLAGDCAEYFKDIKNGYGKLWPIEAARKTEIEAHRAKILGAAQPAQKSKKRVRGRVKKTLKSKKRIRNMIKNRIKSVKKLFKKENYYKAVIKYGAFKARILGLK